MNKKAFTIIELLIVITLAGVMTLLSITYLNISAISMQSTKSQLQLHINTITATILKCKDLSSQFPKNGTNPATNTPLNTLVCRTDPIYQIDGSNANFIPQAPTGFTSYTAIESGNAFYFSTSTPLNSTNHQILEDLKSNYPATQYEVVTDTATATLHFYISR